MKLVRFKIKEILNLEKFSCKYLEGLLTSRLKEKTRTEWELAFEGDNGSKYLVRFRDGRKANQFYAGKEVWGMEKPNPAVMRTGKFDRTEFKGLEFYWWTKEEFDKSLDQHIQRTKEYVENETLELKRLEELKATPDKEVAQ